LGSAEENVTSIFDIGPPWSDTPWIVQVVGIVSVVKSGNL